MYAYIICRRLYEAEKYTGTAPHGFCIKENTLCFSFGMILGRLDNEDTYDFCSGTSPYNME